MNKNVLCGQRSAWNRSPSDLVIRKKYTKKEHQNEYLQDKKD